MARPKTTSYTDEEKAEVATHVICQLASGIAVRRTLEDEEGMPSPSTFWRWVFEDETGELSSKIARAREFGIEAKMAGVHQSGEIEITQEMIRRVLSLLRESGIADHVSELDAPLAGRICRSVLGAARDTYKRRAAFHRSEETPESSAPNAPLS